MYKKFIQALTWNSINIFAYKAILLTHQVILFYFLPKQTYGTSGSIFACIYLIIGFTGFGFDYTLFTFFAHHKQSKAHFRKVIPQYMARLATILIVALGLWIIINKYTHARIIGFLTESIPPTLLPYLLLIFISESIKRSLEILAQLSFLNKSIAKIQISMIACYVILFWSAYFITNQISLHTIFIPMTIISYAEVIFLVSLLYNYYKTLPSHTINTQSLQKNVVIIDQCYNYLNQVTKSFFSPNFLMLMIAFNLGMTQAGSIRFFTNIITLLYMLLNRSIGIPSGALLSNITQQAFNKTKQAFLDITNIYIQFLYVLAITLIINTIPHILTTQFSNDTIMYHILFFILAGFVEYITLTYEKLYITQKAAQHLAIINACSLALLSITLLSPVYTYIPKHVLLLPMCLIRLCTALIVGLYAYKKWHIKPKLTISIKTIFISALSTIGIKLLIAIYQKTF